MSGTSLEGLDVALCCKGSGVENQEKLEKFESVPYSSEIKIIFYLILYT